VPTGFWRGVGPNNNVFAIESFMDELAKKAGNGSGRFPPRHARQESPTARFAESCRGEVRLGQPLPPRVGRGVSVQPSFAGFIATVVEAEVDETGEVRSHRVTCAVDTGIAVNPDTVRAQLEGGLIFGLTAALYGEVTIDKGRVQQSNFNNYRMLRNRPGAEDRGSCHRERRGARRHRRNRRYGGSARSAQRDLCRDRRCAAQAADRSHADRGKEVMSPQFAQLVTHRHPGPTGRRVSRTA